MARFIYQAKTKNGELRKGVVEASDMAAAEGRLRGDGLTVEKMKPEPKAIQLPWGGGVPPKDLQIFTRQLATMIDAGLPLVQCMDILGSQNPNPTFSRALSEIKSVVEQGATFSEALRKHPKIFDELFVNLVAAGEAGGILDTILNRLAVYIEKAVKLKGQLKSALVYPIGVMVVAAAVVTIMLWKVIPVFEKMYKDMGAGAQLPKPTQFVIDLSNSFGRRWYVFIGSAAALVFGFGAARQNPKGRVILDRMFLKLPAIGPVLRKIVVARFTRTLGTLLSSGVPILDALEICGKTAGNKVVEHALAHVRSRISEGSDMAGPLAETQVFPSMVVQMIGVGEQTGAMDQMLQKIADFYEEEVDTAVGGLTAMIEPAMMGFLGVVVGGLIIAMYLPIFSLAGAVGGEK